MKIKNWRSFNEADETYRMRKNTEDDLYDWFFKTYPEMNINSITVTGDIYDKVIELKWDRYRKNLIPTENTDIRVNFSVPINGEKYYNLTIDFDKDGNYINGDLTTPESDKLLGKYSVEIYEILKKNL